MTPTEGGDMVKVEILQGWTQGFHYGLDHAAVATAYIATADNIMSACHIDARTREALWLQAEYDVALEHPDLPITTQKAIAARRIALLIARRLRKESQK